MIITKCHRIKVHHHAPFEFLSRGEPFDLLTFNTLHLGNALFYLIRNKSYTRRTHCMQKVTEGTEEFLLSRQFRANLDSLDVSSTVSTVASFYQDSETGATTGFSRASHEIIPADDVEKNLEFLPSGGIIKTGVFRDLAKVTTTRWNLTFRPWNFSPETRLRRPSFK